MIIHPLRVSDGHTCICCLLGLALNLELSCMACVLLWQSKFGSLLLWAHFPRKSTRFRNAVLGLHLFLPWLRQVAQVDRIDSKLLVLLISFCNGSSCSPYQCKVFWRWQDIIQIWAGMLDGVGVNSRCLSMTVLKLTFGINGYKFLTSCFVPPLVWLRFGSFHDILQYLVLIIFWN